MSPPALLPVARAPLRTAVCAGWVLFTAMVIAISWTGSLLRGRPADLGGTLVWNLGWLFWAGGTFVVARLARRFPIRREAILRGVARHAGLGVAVGVVILALEFLFSFLLERLVLGAPRANAFLGFIVYKFHVYFLIYWMILGATRAYDAQVALQASSLRAAQLEGQLAQARLQALQAQLQPHFLFNTHHAIISLMLQRQNDAAVKMLTRLSDLLRISLAKTDRHLCPLREELDALELYLGIQRERFGERLTVQRAIAPAALPIEVPALLLQPLAENALRHGIDARTAGGILRLEARLTETTLEIVLADDGPGFPAGFAFERAGGIGLRNTRARLAHLYGGVARLECGRSTLGGAEVRVTLPLSAAVDVPAAAPVLSSHG